MWLSQIEQLCEMMKEGEWSVSVIRAQQMRTNSGGDGDSTKDAMILGSRRGVPVGTAICFNAVCDGPK